MNERIQQLIEQATTTQGATRYNPLTHQVFDREKFAQLIVRECMEQIHMQSRGPCGDNHGEWYESDILKHFGFEL